MKIPNDLRWKATGNTFGAGGQAAVHEVYDSTAESGERFAMKVLSSSKSMQAYERFYREIEAIRALDHPSIVKIVDCSEPDADFHFYVMERFEGAQTLGRMLDSAQTPFRGEALRSLDLIELLLESLVACSEHAPPIVHRDLKPGNILILPDDSIKIIDFGICQIEGDTPITLDDEGVGSANYMAPECESGALGSPSGASDLYSVGKILWAVITGKRAFARESPAFTEKSMSEIFPAKPETWHLFHVFEKTIRRDPSDRAIGAGQCLEIVKEVRRLVADGYPPLELQPICPACGYGRLEQFEGSHMVFGNPPPRGIMAVQCSYCGFCFAVNAQKIRDELARRKTLE